MYLTFDSEKSVKALLQLCSHDPCDGSQYYFKVSSRRMRNKEVQVIPWALSDSNSIRCPSPRLDPSRTVFVGGLHGLLNAGMYVCVCVCVCACVRGVPVGVHTCAPVCLLVVSGTVK